MSDHGFRSRSLLPHYCGCTPTRKRRGTIRASRARINILGKPDLELEHDAYSSVPAWNSETRWIAAIQIAHAILWPTIRPSMSETVSLRSIQKTAVAMAIHADHRTGRNCRPTNDRLTELTGMSLSVVQRAKKALRLMGLATEVLRGRQRTLNERLASWRVGDKSRGWASVWALHLPRPTPHLRSGLFSLPPSPKRVVTRKQTGTAGVDKGDAPRRCPDTRGRSGPKRRHVSPQGQKLAAHWLTAARTPRWAYRHTPKGWAPVLRRAGEAGWTPGDLNQLLDEYLASHPTAPYLTTLRSFNPMRFMATVLKAHNNYGDRPAYYIEQQAAEAAAEHNRRSACGRCDEYGWQLPYSDVGVKCAH